MLHSDRGVAERAAELGVPNDFNDVARALIGRGPIEMAFLRKDGAERRHSMSLNRVIDDRGQAIGYVSTSEDITERLEAEARLVESLETERLAVEQLREVDRVKDAFVSSVSHELRTPITSILGYTELLEPPASTASSSLAQLDAVRRVSDQQQPAALPHLRAAHPLQGAGRGHRRRRPGRRPHPGRGRGARGPRPDDRTP